MPTVGQKADYVRGEARKGAGGHHCHWPGCEKPVPPVMWGCKVWRTYRPGQEVSKTPSAEYIAVAREVQAWIAANHPPKQGARDGGAQQPQDR
jgi:hypothetical protein